MIGLGSDKNIYKKFDKLFKIFIMCIQRFCDTPQEATSLCQRFVFNNSKTFLSFVLLNVIVVIKIPGTFFTFFCPYKMVLKNDIRPCSKLARNPHLDAITLDLY